MQSAKCRVQIGVVVLAICLAWTVNELMAQTQESRRPAFQVLDAVRINQRIGERVPLDLAFANASGDELLLEDVIQDRPVILSLVYYECPMLCSQVLNGLLSSVKAMSFDIGDEFDVVTVSFDADEGPDLAAGKKASYIESYGREGASEGWHFLTGRQEAIDKLTESVGFNYVYQEDVDQFAHGSVVIVLTPDGVVSQYHFGITYAPRDLRLAVVEASTEGVGTIVDQVLLYCFNYDPTTGKYGVAILNVIRVAGGLTAGAIAFGIFFLLRKERRGKLDPAEI